MSLCRYFPTPSDRMGILWSLLSIKDSVILEYGPAGTTHYSVGFFGKLNIDNENRLFTTHMSEDDVVMGDVKRLEEAIVEIDQAFSPKVVFVIASSTSSVIGTDLKGVCAYTQEKVNARLIAFENGGLRGDYSIGLYEVYKLLVNEFTEKKIDIIPQTYNIIGGSTGDYRSKCDIEELKRLMKESFDYDIHTTLCLDTSINKISTMSSVQINIVISYEGLASAEYLNSKFGTPFVYSVPYGYSQTLEWLQNISNTINKDINNNILLELKDKISGIQQYKTYFSMFKMVSPKGNVYGNYDKVLGLSKYLEELCLQVENKICSHSLKNITNADNSIKYILSEKERIEIIKSLRHSFVFADDVSKTLLDQTNKYIRFSSPFMNTSQIAMHLPSVGIRGADYIREQYEEYLNSLYY